jgi:hypothetical protein
MSYEIVKTDEDFKHPIRIDKFWILNTETGAVKYIEVKSNNNCIDSECSICTK